MGKKVEKFDGPFMFFFCPGCQHPHPFDHRWEFNGNEEKPTFTPSLLVTRSSSGKRCHSFVKDGNIRFLNDCEHDLKNQTVEIPDWEDDFF